MTGYSLHVGLNVVDTASYIPAPAVLAGCVNDESVRHVRPYQNA